ncbi:hypothetical protein BT67DRAFT_163546 [Trichocladium antarcticum]|uniref:Uncharacterized protein n=1 Tax=Trichocladium antarcticum TaxID=1450529 RepID=A0AAN6UDU5_9PEZI|nr:hypothetical protein BT67DRAFT_163546 [Trichocladium antarcticum]
MVGSLLSSLVPSKTHARQTRLYSSTLADCIPSWAHCTVIPPASRYAWRRRGLWRQPACPALVHCSRGIWALPRSKGPYLDCIQGWMSAGRSHLGRRRLAKPAIAMVLFGSAGRNGYSVLADGTSPGIRSPVVAVVVVGPDGMAAAWGRAASYISRMRPWLERQACW